MEMPGLPWLWAGGAWPGSLRLPSATWVLLKCGMCLLGQRFPLLWLLWTLSFGFLTIVLCSFIPARVFAHSFSEQRSGGGGSHRYKAEGLWANYFICFLIGENEGATPPRAAGRVKGNNACVSSGWPAYRRVSVPPLLALPLSDPPVKLAEAPG